MASFLIALLIGTVFFLSFFGQHRFSPVRIWLAMWTIAWVINFLIGGVFYFSPEVLLIVALGVLFYALGALLFWTRRPDTTPADPAHHDAFMESLLKSRSIGYVTTLLLLLQIILIDRGMRQFSSSNLVQLMSQGRSRMFEIMKESQAALYLNNEFNFPAEFKLVTLFLCFLAIFVFLRLSAANIRRWDIANAFLLIFISLLFSAAANVRSLLLIPMIVGFFSFYSGAILNGRTGMLTKPSTLLGTLCVILGFSIWILVVQSARMGDPYFQRIGTTLDHMRPWFGGYVPALSAWFDENAGNMDHTYGAYFMRAILAPLGLASGEGFDERVDAVAIGNWQTSNAMTIFRVFIADFGAVGAVIFAFILGYCGEAAYQRALRFGGAWVVILIAFNCATFFSINFWFFFYGARVFAFMGAALVMIYLSRTAKRTVLRRVSKKISLKVPKDPRYV